MTPLTKSDVEDAFLPDGYEVPESPGKYMKFKQGDNRFRILERPIIGQEYWNLAGKPVRKHVGEDVNIADVRPEKDGSIKISHFWAMPVWNYAAGLIQVLQVTQKGILKAIQTYAKDEDWGSPLGYDLVVNKTGEQLTTEYETMAKPAKPVSAEVSAAFAKLKAAGFDIERLFDGGDPFAGANSEAVPAGDPDDDEADNTNPLL